jgi:N-acetylneuraminic acid mutarotase
MMLGWTALFAAGSARAADLSFEQRVSAQEAIQRVYYSHQIGDALPFEKAFPRGLLERQVQDYLKQSAALDSLWHTPVTRAALRAEMQRIARSSRFPERLEEIYAALDHDPVWIEECFARPSLVNRLARSFFSGDESIHAAPRAEAEALRLELIRGDKSIDAKDAHRSVAELAVDRTDSPEPASGIGIEPSPPSASAPRLVNPEEFRRLRAELPAKTGEIGPLVDRGDAFVFQAVISETPDRLTVATHSFVKKSWAAWWEENRARFREETVQAVASPSDSLPVVAGSSKPWQPPGGTDSGQAVTAATCLQATWDNGLNNFPDPRSRHAAVWTGSAMIIWGGQNTSGLLGSGAKYDPVTDMWEPISSVNAPSARSSPTAVWTGQVMILWSGESLTDTGALYNPSTDSWTPMSTLNAALGRYRHATIWTGTEMIVTGGLIRDPYNQVVQTSKSGGRYNPATDTWSTMADFADGIPRMDHTAVWTGSELLVWGGTANGTGVLANGSRYNLATNTWTSLSITNQPPPRSQHGAVWTGTRMIVWGGVNGTTYLTSGGQYDLASNTWVPTSTIKAAAGKRPDTYWTGSLMLAWGGSANAVTQYNPATDTWSDPTPFYSSPTRYDETSVWTGSQLLVWGGAWATSPPGPTYGNGARYDLASNTWTPISQTAPEARQLHTAIWTGSLMIVWGGITESQNLFNDQGVSTGGRYDPLTDSWTATSTANAPSPRSHHSAVWTGSRMIVWGGATHSTALNTGGRYDPAADTWTATSTTGAPSVRQDHTTIWTGTRMVVWGGLNRGQSPNQYLNTGGVYNPTSNNWSSTSTTGAPAGRYLHTAIWTGSRMIVWGGVFVVSITDTPTDQVLNTGGLYNPTNDGWSSISTINAPTPRSGHTAVWTGSEMIVWGGVGSSYPFSNGARYDPQTNQWTSSLSTTSAPRARYSHTAVWTGSAMIVYGGWKRDVGGSGSTEASGGIYLPGQDTWLAVPSAGAPSARAFHSAIWTGTQMIVWGGAGAGYNQGGGRLELDTLPDVDADLDGYGVCSGDCNDGDASIHPGAAETCNGLDDNCAGGIDEAFDQDLDGFATCGGDCNDANATINPAAPEVCDHVDNNCNLYLDDGFPDADHDSYAACVDCNDSNATIYPGYPELCNGLDDNCNGSVDEGGDARCEYDPNDCLDRTCGGTSGCVGTLRPAGAPCSDNNLCTQTDTCNGSSSICQGSNPVVCTPIDSCHNAGTCSPGGGCSNPAKPFWSSCDDGDPCTMNEACTPPLLVCQGGRPLDYDYDGHFPPACGGDDCDDLTGSVWGQPQEVTNLTVTSTSPANPTWDSQSEAAGWGTVYDLTSGTLNGSGGLDTASAVCLLHGALSTNYNDSRPDPEVETGIWYLSRARNSCGTGTYGFDSNSVERSIPACP